MREFMPTVGKIKISSSPAIDSLHSKKEIEVFLEVFVRFLHYLFLAIFFFAWKQHNSSHSIDCFSL
jgi:hypothetical protein